MLEPVLNLPLFGHGTLQSAVCVGQLLERPVDGEAAALLDYDGHELLELSYEVVCEAPGKEVSGQLYRDLSAEDLVRLDAYEGVAEGLYRRVIARVVSRAARELEAPAPLPEGAYVYVPTRQTMTRYG